VIKLPLQLVPEPRKEKAFTAQSVGAINFLVGPNGSGKSRFAIALKQKLAGARILNTDHLEGMEGAGAFRTLFGDHFAGGLAKNSFPQFKQIRSGYLQ
jgi:ABC-type cobalamin transport system ATPase subunit